MLTERDWVMRVVKQVAELLARALKLARDGQHERARETITDGCLTALGMEWRVLVLLDARTVVELLKTPQRVDTFARLLEAMADVEALSGEAARAERLRQHAAEVRGAAVS